MLGGYGNFGARISRILAVDSSIELLVAARDRQRARTFAANLGHGVMGIGIDHSSQDFSNVLKREGVRLVIHTAGPFQQQGYNVAAAAAAAGSNYIDLADGRRFVCDFPNAMNATFVAAECTAICGASTVPALSSAVIDHLCQNWRRIDTIDICIAPAQTAPRGKATLAAVLSYCGQAIQVWDAGRWQSKVGWIAPEPVRIARLRPRLGALCDIPDLELFPARYGATQRVMFRAALEVKASQRAFAALAALCSAGIIKRPSRVAGFLNAVAPALDFLGSALGGMVVQVEGQDAEGRTTRREWHIAADDDHGPEIPCMAAVLLARKFAKGERFPSGAFTSTGLLGLAEFAPEFVRWGMVTDTLEVPLERDALPRQH